ESRTLPPFHTIELDGVGTIVFNQAQSQSFQLEGPDSHVAAISAEVIDGVLIISTESRTIRIMNSGLVPRYIVSAPTLRKLTISGAGRAEIGELRTESITIAVDGAGDVRLPKLQVDHCQVTIGGAGNVRAAGIATRQEIAIVGTGNFSGDELVGESVHVSIAGAGRAKVHATADLRAEIGGVGQISYLGDPKVHSEITGLGRIKRA
ncbi:MAG TPA: head GIN domain-containing protein, partial [Thermomicrobiales bacterium]|nr:head GIN domain-containing protein [Thermomicrobiales bacterium]